MAAKKSGVLALAQGVIGEPGTDNGQGQVFFVSPCPYCHNLNCGMIDTAADVYQCSITGREFSANEFETMFCQAADDGSGGTERRAITVADPGQTKSSRLIAGGVNLVLEDASLDAVAYNEMAGAVYVRGVLPWAGRAEYRPWTNADDANFTSYVQARHGINKTDAERVLTIVADKRRYNPLADLLDGLPAWDGESERSGLLIDYLGARDNAYNRAVTQLLFNGAVMRALSPGCKFDTCTTLVGGQGIGKSTLCNALALQDEYFIDNVGDISKKDAAENLAGRWIVEIGELASFRKREVETVKLFLSQRWDTYRAAYAKRSEQRPRRCIFIATSNSAAFLNDHTGARRFLPVRCGDAPPRKNVFDPDTLAADVRQAYAQTMALYREHGGLPLVLPAELGADALAAQEAFAAEDTKSGLVAEWLKGLEYEGSLVCTLQIMQDVFEIGREDANRGQNKAFQAEVVAIMDNRMPGWQRVNDGRKVMHSKEYGQQRCWTWKGVVT